MNESEQQLDEPVECHEALSLGYPWPLAKATIDPFDYALETKSGLKFRFLSAEVCSAKLVKINGGRAGNGYQAAHPRGTYIRLDEIVWVADAPEGS